MLQYPSRIPASMPPESSPIQTRAALLPQSNATLSFGVLAHNCAPYIEKLLLAAHMFADEVVVGVDASSTDATEEICARYADKVFLLEPIGTSE
jgi:hypothetical protein